MATAETTPTAEAPHHWGRDLMASFVVFLVALPLCMGVAIASGVPPALGLITGIVGGIVVGLFAGSPLQVSGPAAGLAVLVWELVQAHGLASLGVAVVAAGLLQLAAGAAKMGRWFRAVSPALIQGMLAGIGVLIFASQFHLMIDAKPTGNGLKDLVTIPLAAWSTLAGPEGAHGAAIIGVLSIVAIVAWNKLRPDKLKAVPGPLVAVILGTVLANAAGMKVSFVAVPESLASSMNVPSLASFGMLLDAKFLSATVGLALIASAETLLCATATDRLTHHSETDYDKELMAQGAGNTIAGLFGALPVCGVIVRSSANVEAGARTRWSSVAHGIWLLALVVAFPVVLTSIPTSCLAAILVYTGYKLAHPRHLVAQWQAGRGEALVFGITVVAIVSTNLLTGVVLGLACGLLKLLAIVATVDVDVEARGNTCEVTLHGAATFVRLPKLAAALESIPSGKEVVLHVGGLAYIDHACMDLLRQWQERYERKGGHTTVAWDDLELRHTGARPQLALAAAALANGVESSATPRS
jgi:MFS superfamily sulfate permease-like transporter